ncbi:LytR C-terminal domain-containing protein [Streptomyces sp. SID13031]|uniref:LytR C-terminal domain-containing protein n=1 Tax=Streptomyces sp. SID13031 TaxID=2706046 RepID=UPI0013C86F83|nr:LytR C-terminal domain-containing protein [Streptomyces sp. SID13031]NEA35395.1 LytR C-terminal domain-containing protein [Streptomyces sp. SID13031]
MSALQAQPRPHSRIHWRTPITMVVLLGVLVGGGWWGWNSLTQSSAEPTCVDTQMANDRLTPKQVSVNVYNGGAKAGTAAAVAKVLTKRGFHVNKIANEPKGDKVVGVVLRGTTVNAPEMNLIAGQVKGKVKAAADARSDHTVDLVVGVGYPGLRDVGIPSIALPKNSTLCLPSIRPTQPIPSGQNPN